MLVGSSVTVGDWAQLAGTVLIALTVVLQFVYNRKTIEISRSINFKSQWNDIYDSVVRSPGSLEMIGIKQDAIGKDIDVNQVISFWLLHNFFQHWVDATKGEMNRDTCPTFFDMMESEMGSRYWALTEHTFTREWRDEVALALQRSQRP